MARIKDPQARRGAVHYPKGRVTGCQGLLAYIFDGEQNVNTAEIKSDKNGRRRLANFSRRVSASGGKQIRVFTRDGQEYSLHYAGTLVDFRLGAVPRMRRDRVLGWATERGTKQNLF